MAIKHIEYILNISLSLFRIFSLKLVPKNYTENISSKITGYVSFSTTGNSMYDFDEFLFLLEHIII